MHVPAERRDPVSEELKSDPRIHGGFVPDGPRRDFLKRVFVLFVSQIFITLIAAYIYPWISLDHDYYYKVFVTSLISFAILLFSLRWKVNVYCSALVLLIFTITNAASFTIVIHKEFEFTLTTVGLQAIACALVLRWAKSTEVDITGWVNLATAILADACLDFLWAPTDSPPMGYMLLKIAICSAILAIIIQILMGGKEHELSPDEPILGALLLHSAFFATFNYFAVVLALPASESIFKPTKRSGDSSDQSSDSESAAV